MNHADIFKLRLASQQLAGTECTNIPALVAKMGALQAQDYTMSKWAIGIRIPGTTDQLVEEAISRGEILRTHILRPTWHWVAAENIRWMAALSAPRVKSAVASRDKQLGLDESIFGKSNELIIEILSGGKQLTRTELQEELAKKGIATDTWQIAHLAMRAELDAIICNGTSKDKKQTYALVDELVPKTTPLSREEALAKLVGIFFSSHGPATLDDFVWWSGLSKTEARQGLEMNKQILISEKCDSQEYWMSPSIPELKGDEAYFLPAFDEFIVSYKGRSAILADQHYKKIITSNGIFKPAIVF